MSTELSKDRSPSGHRGMIRRRSRKLARRYSKEERIRAYRDIIEIATHALEQESK